MATWRWEHRNVYELDAWQKAEAFSTLLHDVCHDLHPGRDKEWLRYLLIQAGQLMREAVETGWHRAYLAECLLGIAEALTFLALVDYYLVFLRHEGYLTMARADEVDQKLHELQEEFAALAGRLRDALGAHPEGPFPASWSRN